MLKSVSLLLSCFCLAGCVTNWKLIYEKHGAPEVYSRATGKLCPRVYSEFSQELFIESYGGDCQVQTRRPIK